MSDEETVKGGPRPPAGTAETGHESPVFASVAKALEAAAPQSSGEPRWWRDVRRRRLLALADCCAVSLALGLVLPSERAIWILAFLPVWILVAKLAGLYDADHREMRHLTVDEAPTIIAWGVIGAAAASLLGELTPAGSLSTGELAGVAAIAIGAGLLPPPGRPPM